MRLLAISLGGIAGLSAALALGAVVLDHQHQLSVKQTRALNADIERIIAERHDKTQAFTAAVKAGLPAFADIEGSSAVATHVRMLEQTDPTPVPETTGVSAAAVDRDDAKDNQDSKETRIARAQRSAKRRSARVSGGPERLLPLAFASLPKFTTHTLLGLR